MAEPLSQGSAFRCKACGFDLRGHAEDGRCPECGSSIASTLAAMQAHANHRRFWRVYGPLFYAFAAYFVVNCIWTVVLILTDACELWSSTMLWPHLLFAAVFTFATVWRARIRGHADVVGGALTALASIASVVLLHLLLFTGFCVGWY